MAGTTTEHARQPLGGFDRAVLGAYARGADVADIALRSGRPREHVGQLLLKLCRLNRQRAAELWRTGRAPAVYAPTPVEMPEPAPRPAVHAAEPTVLPRRSRDLTTDETAILYAWATGATLTRIAATHALTLAVVVDQLSALCDLDRDKARRVAARGYVTQQWQVIPAGDRA